MLPQTDPPDGRLWYTVRPFLEAMQQQTVQQIQRPLCARPRDCLSLRDSLRLFCDILKHRYNTHDWWPRRTDSRWEIAAGAILAQNTSWRNAFRALTALLDAGMDEAAALSDYPDRRLEELIRPAGFFRRKLQTLRLAADFFTRYEAAVERSADCAVWRSALLQIPGIGRETADTILLFAFDKPIFVVDAYTRRVGGRHFGMDPKLPYDALQQQFSEALPPESPPCYRQMHALITELCKESCRRRCCSCTFLPEALCIPHPAAL